MTQGKEGTRSMHAAADKAQYYSRPATIKCWRALQSIAKAKGWTQAQLATEVRISETMLRKMESGTMSTRTSPMVISYLRRYVG